MRHVLRFLAVSMCAGIVAAGLAIPVAGTTAAALGEGMSLFDAMPAEFDDRPLAQPSTLLTKDGKEFATFSWQNRDEVALDQVSQAMQDATLAIEDRRFYEHGPVDVEGVALGGGEEPPHRFAPRRVDADPAVCEERPHQLQSGRRGR